jgi:hypothetical protein
MTLPRPDAVPPDDEEETLWALLLSDIERGWIVPVVGRDLLVVKATDAAGNEVEAPYYGLVADELAKRLTLPPGLITPDSPNPIGVVATEYLARGGDPNRLYRPVRLAIDAVNARRSPEPPAALQKLASIGELRAFVTTTFDSILEDALAAARGISPQTMAFAPGPLGELGRFQAGENRDRTVAMLRERADPVLVHVFGKVSDTPDFVVTEEDAFEFIYQLQQSPPKGLVDLLSQLKLLFIGCRFPSWLVRFFLRTARRQRLLGAGPNRIDFVVDPDAASDTALVEFLRKFKTQTELFSRYRPIQFVDELHSRYTKRRVERGADVDEQNWMTRCSIFISYASEDTAAALALAAKLQQLEVPVWLDRAKLSAGNDWAQKIRQNIEAAAAFVPILSRSTANAPPNREFRKEWRYAEDVLRGTARTDDFIFPLVVDDLSRSEPRIDAELRAIHWTALPQDGELPDDFVKALRNARRRCQLPPRPQK